MTTEQMHEITDHAVKMCETMGVTLKSLLINNIYNSFAIYLDGCTATHEKKIVELGARIMDGGYYRVEYGELVCHIYTK